jgi:hypothetical protein
MKNNDIHKLLGTIWESTSDAGAVITRGTIVKIDDVMTEDNFNDGTIWYYPVELYNGEYYELDEEHNSFSDLPWFFDNFKRVWQ